MIKMSRELETEMIPKKSKVVLFLERKLTAWVIEKSEFVGEVAFLYRAVTHAQERLDRR